MACLLKLPVQLEWNTFEVSCHLGLQIDFPLRAWFNFILENMKEWKELIAERLPRKTVEKMFVILIE